jgi:hypothetical protein
MSQQNIESVYEHKRIHSDVPVFEKIFLLICGEKTERDYFVALKDLFNLRSFAQIEIEATGWTPDTLANNVLECANNDNKVIKIKGKNKRDVRCGGFDEYWIVFDRDDYKSQEINKALFLNKRCKKVRVAMSNPCFELWILIHFKDYNAPGSQNDVSEVLKKELMDKLKFKRKRKELPPIKYYHTKYYNDAIVRAKNLVQEHENNDDGKQILPYTQAHLLTARLIALSEKNGLIKEQLRKLNR